MKQIAQHYKSGELALLDVPAPSCRPGGILVKTAYSVISAGTEMMKVSESKLSLLGKARARPDQVKKVLNSVKQQGLTATYEKVMNRLDSYTPLGYSLSGIVVEVGAGTQGFRVGDRVACAGNKYALHAEYNWVPTNLCVSVPEQVPLQQAAFATVAAIALQGVRQSDLKLGETACVIGLGLLGQILVRLLRGAGVFVVGLDIVPERCKLAEQGGAAAAGIPESADFPSFVERVSALTCERGLDCVLIAAGGRDNRPVELAAELLRDRGRVIDIGKCNLDLPWNAYYEKELDVRFSRSYGPGRYDPRYEESGIDYPIGYVRWTERRNMECVIALVAEQRLDFSPLVTDVFAFDEAVAVYERMNRGELNGLGVLFRYKADQERRESAPVVSANVGARIGEGRLRLGVIGAGNYASSMLLPFLAANNEVRLAAVATNTGLSAANAVKKFSFERAMTDAHAVIEAEDIDAVLIATRHASHAALVCAALRAGKAVFVEKPLSISGEGLSEIARTMMQSGNERLMVGFNRRFSPLMAEMKSEWGARNASHILHYRVNAGPLEKGSWYSEAETEGSRFVGEGGHFIDTASWWIGADPVKVSAASTRDDPDNLAVTLSYPDGSLAVVTYLTHGQTRFPKERVEVFGEGRTGVLDNFGRFEIWAGGKVKSKKARMDKGQKSALEAFVKAVRNGTSMPISASSLFSTTLATLRSQESALRGAPLAVDVALAIRETELHAAAS